MPFAVGDRLRFRYPDARRFKHRFYTQPPGSGGRLVPRQESSVDLHGIVDVLEVKWSDWQQSHWVAVRFQQPDGQQLWTNASKDGREWMVHESLGEM